MKSMKENKEKFEEKIKEKKIAETDCKISLVQYQWAMQTRNGISNVEAVLFIIVMLLLGVIQFLFAGGRYYSISFVLLLGAIIIGMIRFVVYPRTIKKAFHLLEEGEETENHYEFYETYIFRSNKRGTSNMMYSEFTFYFEDQKYITAYTKLNRIIILEKSNCSEEILNLLRNAVPQEKLKKVRNAKIRRKILGILCALILAGTVAWTSLSNQPKNNYPYTTYDSFINCAKYQLVDEVVIDKEILTYKYIGNGKEIYYNSVIDGDLDELIEILDTNEISWTYKE